MARKKAIGTTATTGKKGMHGCVVAAIIFGVIIAVIFLLTTIAGFFGAYRYRDALKKAGFNMNLGQQKVSLRDPKTGQSMDIGAGAKIPGDFPVPAYPGSTSTIVMVADDASTVTLISNDPVDRIEEWYKRELPRNGFKLNESVKGIISFEGHGYEGAIFLTGQGGQSSQSSININLQK